MVFRPMALQCFAPLHISKRNKNIAGPLMEQRKDRKRPKLKFLETLGELSTVPVKIHAP